MSSRVRQSAGRAQRLIGRARPLLGQRSVVRFALLVAMIGVSGLAALLAPRPAIEQVRDAADRLGPVAPIVAVLLGAVLLVALVPRTFITLAWGAVFGPLYGAGYTLAAALLAAAVGFAVGRLLGQAFVSERARGRLARLKHWFARQSVLGVATVRLLPFASFGLVSYGYGTTGARITPFLAGTLISAVPSAFGYAAVGAAVVSPGDLHWLSVTPAALGLVATAVLLVQGFRAERHYRATRVSRQATS